MRAIIKRMLKLLVRQMPMYQLRAAMLRWCGYALGKDVFIGEDLLIVDEPSDRGMVSIGDRVAISPRVTLVVSSRPDFSRIAPYVPVKHGPITIENDA
jgi:acetyltransferase-like isoleucine patch superfamily enzyme